jgi:hypothetical protein
MIFMSQSGLTDTARAADWDRWYVAHLDLMVSVPGVSSAQRFTTTTRGYPPSLAMYSVASPEVFQDPYYLSVRGMGEWLPLIDRQYYRRNLFDGLERAPELELNEILFVADRERLACVGVDRSTPYRGIAIGGAATAERVGGTTGVALYRPATPCHKPK